MPAIKLSEFGGSIPAWDNHLLPNGQAARSLNCYLFSGRLEGWRKPKVLRDLLNTAARFVYRIPIISETQALAYLVAVTQPNAADTVTIGDFVYTFRATIDAASPPGDVLIGGDTTETLENLLAAITADNGTNANAGVKYGSDTTANNQVKWYKDTQTPADGLPAAAVGIVNIGGLNYAYLQVGSVDFGEAFNEVGVAESTGDARLTWLRDLLSLSDTTTTYTGGTNPVLDSRVTAASTWLEYEDQDTNVLKSQVVDDVFERYYTASPSQQPKYNTYDRIVAGQPFWLLGVPAPGCAPQVDTTGGGNTMVLGYDHTGSGSLNGNANVVYLIPVTPEGATTLTDVSFNLTADFSTAHFAGVLYADDGAGNPGELLATGEIVTGAVSGVNASSFLNPPGLLDGITYWVGVMSDTAFTFNDVDGAPTTMAYYGQTFTNGPLGTAPDTTHGLTTAQQAFSIFANGSTTDVIEARSYVYTWVSAYGEEGPPSPATLLNGWSNGVWTIGLWTPPANDQGVLRNLTSLNIYRTVTSEGGTATYFLVANVPIGTLTYVDTIKNDVVALNSIMPSTNWFPPPENLQGLLAMPNGMMAGFFSNQVWFCEPYHPHAWPPNYVLTTEFPIVGIGLTNGGLVVCTSTVPYVILGSAPGAMSMTKCAKPNPCTARGSIVGDDRYVSFMGPNGLVQVTAAGQANNVTENWVTRERWQTLAPQKYARAVHLASCYFCYGTTSPANVSPADNSLAQQGFTIELDDDNRSFTIWPQPGGHRLGFNELNSFTGADIDNVLIDPWTGVGLLVSDGKVWYFDFTDTAPEMVPYTWRSKTYQQNTKKNYEAMKVFFTIPSTAPTLGTRLDAPADDPRWLALAANQYGILRTYVDYDGSGSLTLIDCREIRASGELLRVVSGFKAEQWAWEIEGRVPISNVQIATSAKELKNV